MYTHISSIHHDRCGEKGDATDRPAGNPVAGPFETTRQCHFYSATSHSHSLLGFYSFLFPQADIGCFFCAARLGLGATSAHRRTRTLVQSIGVSSSMRREEEEEEEEEEKSNIVGIFQPRLLHWNDDEPNCYYCRSCGCTLFVLEALTTFLVLPECTSNDDTLDSHDHR
jgi:hypothetical protein